MNEKPYESTSNAIWQLMYEYGISKNNGMSLSDKSRELLNKAKSGISILSAEPTSEQTSRVQIVGDTTFSKKTDGKWYTGKLHVEEPADFHGAYTITLPEGTSLYEGSTLVKAGETFQLVSEKKPEGTEKVTVSAKIPWLKSVKMYSPVKNGDQEVTASDGKSFQHMVGAEIETAAVGASADLKVSTETPNPSNPPSTTDPSKPVNPSNPSTPTDPSTPVTPPNPVNPNGPVIPPNQENTSASEEPASPEHTVSRETPAANLPAASKKPTTVKKSEGNGKQKVSASVLPKTGDSSHVMLWGLGLIGCGAAALGLLTLRIRNRREE
ncbi:LPXTG cell wall anchor domain-containing protein [uncultured Eubacterium sp.]|uniref:LPXTG cell wall anchor domain-containing protein n=1 Tax=uncultured Eubacterium sp. TaxID=165185 RepID=UPI00259A0D95|nr:LPXTG cell wall anchor domain-containing protein [uncultured Eubacterium sp.]